MMTTLITKGCITVQAICDEIEMVRDWTYWLEFVVQLVQVLNLNRWSCFARDDLTIAGLKMLNQLEWVSASSIDQNQVK
jgi:hypothetical protein